MLGLRQTSLLFASRGENRDLITVCSEVTVFPLVVDVTITLGQDSNARFFTMWNGITTSQSRKF